MTNEEIAKVAHEVNRAYCKAMGDESQRPWEEAPEWQKISALAGVELHLRNPGLAASASHEAWKSHKEAEGWVYGLKKDEELKTHPCMVEFCDLSLVDQAKDYLFKQTVLSLVELDKKEEPNQGVKGYNRLSETQVQLMNNIKDKGQEVGELLTHLEDLSFIDKRSIAIARTELQTGFMWAVRAIAKPSGF